MIVQMPDLSVVLIAVAAIPLCCLIWLSAKYIRQADRNRRALLNLISAIELRKRGLL